MNFKNKNGDSVSGTFSFSKGNYISIAGLLLVILTASWSAYSSVTNTQSVFGVKLEVLDEDIKSINHRLDRTEDEAELRHSDLRSLIIERTEK